VNGTGIVVGILIAAVGLGIMFFGYWIFSSGLQHMLLRLTIMAAGALILGLGALRAQNAFHGH
jgi:hypothetical protein